jgi:FtsP/CotA-like multicopper oxidase with cupredoxin domain
MMNQNTKKRAGTRLVLLVSLALFGALAVGGAGASAAVGSTHKVGVVCTAGNLSGTVRSFDLTTHEGYIDLPDGTSAYMWGYSEGANGFQHPGPVLCVKEGETVNIVLHNTLARDVSIVFPGQENVLANGDPAQPQFNGSGALTSLTDVAAASGGSVTYSFTAANPGTYLYESGTDPEIQVRMGLFGALIVRPAMGDNFVYDRADSQFNPNTEFLELLSEIDTNLNRAMELGRAFDITKYHPRYWLINGRGFPDSVADNGASWLPAQPYGSLVEIQPHDAATNAEPAVTRYLSVGTEDYPFHPHGNNGTVIGRDGHPMAGPGGEDISFEKFSVPVGPGQTWDVLFSWKDDNSYSESNPVPVDMPNLANMVVGMFYGGSPYLGVKGTLPTGQSTLNECGEFYIISHNHALYQLTSGGVTMTGPITYTRVDPPLPNSCP